MKKILILLLLLGLSSPAFSQLRKMYQSSGTATTAFTKIYKSASQKITVLDVSNDAASGTDTLWIAWNQDTTRPYMFPLLQGETIYWDAVYVDTVRVKTSASTIPYRARYH